MYYFICIVPIRQIGEVTHTTNHSLQLISNNLLLYQNTSKINPTTKTNKHVYAKDLVLNLRILNSSEMKSILLFICLLLYGSYCADDLDEEWSAYQGSKMMRWSFISEHIEEDTWRKLGSVVVV